MLLLLVLSLLLLALIAVQWISERLDQPSVLGQLLLGVIVGNLGVSLGEPFFEIVMSGESHEGQAESASASRAAIVFTALAELGAILLLFSAGLKTSIADMKQVGGRAAAVAALGVTAPFGLAYAVCAFLHLAMSITGHLFLAATLSATSVGITASVLRDLKALDRRESQIIVGAAVIDDVLGLMLLAMVVQIAISGTADLWMLSATAGTAIAFIAGVLVFGEFLGMCGSQVCARLYPLHGRQLFSLAFAFGVACLAIAVDLAPIVGAFAAGLVMTDRFQCAGKEANVGRTTATVSDSIAPIEVLLAPLFFAYVGMQVDVSLFLNAQTLLLASVFSVCAVVGKLVAGLPSGLGLDRLTVGIGMVPRGEVGLVFLGTGRGLGIVSDSIFAALVIVVFFTTVVTPPALKWALERRREVQGADR